MITQRAFLVVIVGFCFYLIAIVNELPTVFYALTWLTVSILMSSLGIALLSLVGLNCRWRANGARVSENLADPAGPAGPSGHSGHTDRAEEAGSTAGGLAGGPTVDIALSNIGTLNKTNVVLEISLHECRRDELLKRRFLLEALPSGSSVECALQLHNLPRGRYRVTGIRMMGSDVLGLFRVQRQVFARTGGEPDNAKARLNSGSNEEDLVVGPAMLSLEGVNLSMEGGGSVGEGAAARYHGQSDELRGTRPYVAGDDLRRVHWKSTARLGSLVVKEFHRTTHAQTIVVWDGVPAEVEPDQQEPLREFSLRLAASLCRTLTERGRTCSLLRLDTNPLWCAAGGQANSNNGTVFLSRVTEVLADAQAGRGTSLAMELRTHLAAMPPGCEVYLLSAAPAPEQLQAVRFCAGRGGQVVVGDLEPDALSAEALDDSLDSLRQHQVKFVRIAPDSDSMDSAAALRKAMRTLLDGSKGARGGNRYLSNGGGSIASSTRNSRFGAQDAPIAVGAAS